MTLIVEGVAAGYGVAQVLFDVSIGVGQGEAVSLIGRNGMGKTTLVRTIMGLVPARTGVISFHGHPLIGEPPFRIAQRGLGLVPEGRQIFANLTVEENLLIAAADRRRANRWGLSEIYAMFPRLRQRRGNWGQQLSGGEQQMLAIARALMTHPLLLLLDEATEGLAPLIRKEIWAVLSNLRQEGLAMIVIDKNLGELVKFIDRHVVLERGKIVWSGNTAELMRAKPQLERYLHV
jgi:branched-chain amino acid transport system ATP-binding protein